MPFLLVRSHAFGPPGPACSPKDASLARIPTYRHAEDRAIYLVRPRTCGRIMRFTKVGPSRWLGEAPVNV